MLSIQDASRCIKSFVREERQNEWNLQLENKFFKIHPNSRYSPYSSILLSRRNETIINRLRAGHSFLTHSYKMAKLPAPMCGECDQSLSVQHIFECSGNDGIAKRRRLNIVNWTEDIMDENKLLDVIKYIKELGYFNLI